jgi:Arc/MetJ-type ribon-helix-helix transcriptional regulator
MYIKTLEKHSQGDYMSVPYRITIRLSEYDITRLEKILDQYNYESISDIIREAIKEFLERNDEESINKKVEVQLTRKMLDDLNTILDKGDAISIDDLIRSVLKEYTRSKLIGGKKDDSSLGGE